MLIQQFRYVGNDHNWWSRNLGSFILEKIVFVGIALEFFICETFTHFFSIESHEWVLKLSSSGFVPSWQLYKLKFSVFWLSIQRTQRCRWFSKSLVADSLASSGTQITFIQQQHFTHFCQSILWSRWLTRGAILD